MSQNIYDTPTFFENYSKMDRSIHGLDGAAEWPRLKALLPDVKGLRILDLGCGFGWFCRWAMEHGAESVHGIDISQNMLQRARAMSENRPEYAGITYQREDLDQLQLPENYNSGFDLVFSSLAVHYLVNLPSLVKQVYRVLKPGGHFVFSAEHPIFTGPSKPGIKEDADGHRFWPLDNYQREGSRVTNWLADGVVKQHRTVATYIGILLESEFQLTGFEEWRPTEEELKIHPDWVDELIRPTFMLVRGKK